MKKKVIVLMSVIVMASGLNACSNNQSATSVKEISEAGTYRTTGLRTKSFISSMGCYNSLGKYQIQSEKKSSPE